MDMLLFAAQALVALLLLVGLAGAILPFLPGAPLIFVAALVYALATDFQPIDGMRLAILGGLGLLAQVLESVAGALGARGFGGSGWAVAGALLGAVVGIFFGPPGLVLGPVIGAVAFELLRSGRIAYSLKAGFGALLGVLLGLLARVTLAFTMVALFLWWLWQG